MARTLKESERFWLRANAVGRRVLYLLYHPPPRTIFHYTSAEGLLGILRDGVIRGSNYHFMNDTSEIAYGNDLVNDALDRAIARGGRLVQEFGNAIRSSEAFATTDAYFTCFCAKPDLLSQWRGYGNDDGRYCLEFRSAGFKHIDSSPLSRVVYERRVQREMIRRIVNAYFNTVTHVHGSPAAIRQALIAGAWSFRVRTFLALPLLKNTAFIEEDECRAVRLIDTPNDLNAVEFHRYGGVLKPTAPVLQVRRGKLPLKRVITGASRLPSRSATNARLMLAKYGYAEVPVVSSGVPLSG